MQGEASDHPPRTKIVGHTFWHCECDFWYCECYSAYRNAIFGNKMRFCIPQCDYFYDFASEASKIKNPAWGWGTFNFWKGGGCLYYVITEKLN